MSRVRDAVDVLDDDEDPRIVVLDKDGKRILEHGRPNLEVVRGGGEHSDPNQQDDKPVRLARVSLVRQAAAPATPDPLVSLSDGHIRLAGDPDVWQTLVSGSGARTYRVHCDEGELMVWADGEPMARVEAGQSTDLEATILRARACGEAPARGRFRPV